MAADEPEQRRVRTRDGVELAYYTVGEGPAVLIANALGCDLRLWRHQVGYLADRYRLITWDYRGLFGSTVDRDVSLGIEDHARDALAVLESEGIERAAVIGWSFGVAVAVELFHVVPEHVACLVLLNGLVGAPPHPDLGFKLTQRAWTLLLRLSTRAPAAGERLLRRMVRSPEALAWAKRIGLVGRDDDEELLRDAAVRLARVDRRLLTRLLEAHTGYDGRAVLDTVDVPVLSLAGERDPFVGRGDMQSQAQRVAGAEFVVVPGATHYLPADSPQFLSLRLEKFFHERGYAAGPQWSSS